MSNVTYFSTKNCNVTFFCLTNVVKIMTFTVFCRFLNFVVCENIVIISCNGSTRAGLMLQQLEAEIVGHLLKSYILNTYSAFESWYFYLKANIRCLHDIPLTYAEFPIVMSTFNKINLGQFEAKVFFIMGGLNPRQTATLIQFFWLALYLLFCYRYLKQRHWRY